jgi:Tfp pilus assembly protein PilE
MYKKASSGFTLIETLVYLGLFALIMGGLVMAAYMLFETSDRNQTKAMMQEEENYLLGKINWALSGASSVSVPATNFLSVTKYDGTNVTITTSSGDMTFNGALLNNSNVTIGNLVFIHTYLGGTNPDSVEAGFTISAKTPDGKTISEIASTTRYRRK